MVGSVWCLVGIFFFFSSPLSSTWSSYQGLNQRPQQWKHNLSFAGPPEVPWWRLEMAPQIQAGQVCQLPFTCSPGLTHSGFFLISKSYHGVIVMLSG